MIMQETPFECATLCEGTANAETLALMKLLAPTSTAGSSDNGIATHRVVRIS